ncbi:hypothetical protein P152DRAFT_38025 [Eremomyces bilateralis CBS 781.70]|uniref:Uncharacterized protein n=1 Tax=Eremomyces bilateralis CBS 781.70 TaxID=1392243 RepID=A0A6G1G1L2_9PEZI|nr:uncharacterized protein P152DRAFT_38025 [Eremomyces bilateralis CBS 781.70]KAF1811933.1 hypothetical protein P152DRAFT_38025 [Eremomyces bilateralis CBS 781.70]
MLGSSSQIRSPRTCFSSTVLASMSAGRPVEVERLIGKWRRENGSGKCSYVLNIGTIVDTAYRKNRH